MGKTWTRIDPKMGLTPIPFMSGLIKINTFTLRHINSLFSVSNLTYLPSYEPIKCTKEVVCQLRPCYMLVEERLRDEAENGKLSIPVPNPSETSSLKMRESWTYRKRQMPIRSTNDMFILSSKLNKKVVWIALSEDDQQLRKKEFLFRYFRN